MSEGLKSLNFDSKCLANQNYVVEKLEELDNEQLELSPGSEIGVRFLTQQVGL